MIARASQPHHTKCWRRQRISLTGCLGIPLRELLYSYQGSKSCARVNIRWTDVEVLLPTDFCFFPPPFLFFLGPQCILYVCPLASVRHNSNGEVCSITIAVKRMPIPFDGNVNLGSFLAKRRNENVNDTAHCYAHSESSTDLGSLSWVLTTYSVYYYAQTPCEFRVK